jgi:hypothetical protein
MRESVTYSKRLTDLRRTVHHFHHHPTHQVELEFQPDRVPRLPFDSVRDRWHAPELGSASVLEVRIDAHAEKFEKKKKSNIVI